MLRVREVVFGDLARIRQLNERNGIGTLDPIAWRESRETYPFAPEFRSIPTGWVLVTDDGSVVGNLDNVHMLYELGGRRFKGAIASGWVVDPEFRGKALQLMTTFLRQKGIDLFLVVSASQTTARVLTAMKIPRIPLPDYETPCFWAVRHRAFARAALRRRSVPGAALLSWPVGLALLTRDICIGSGRGRISSPVHRITEFDDRFDGLFQSTVARRLRAVRTRAVLEWRFRSELRNRRAVILTAERGEVLAGYTMLVRREGSELGMQLYDVADIQAAGDDPATYKDLLIGAIGIAREDGMDAVKFMSGTPAKRAPADELRPYTYRLPIWQLYYKASPELGSMLSTADAWDFSLFDTY